MKLSEMSVGEKTKVTAENDDVVNALRTARDSLGTIPRFPDAEGFDKEVSTAMEAVDRAMVFLRNTIKKRGKK